MRFMGLVCTLDICGPKQAHWAASLCFAFIVAPIQFVLNDFVHRFRDW